MVPGRGSAVSSLLTWHAPSMLTIDSNFLELMVHHHLRPLVGDGTLNHPLTVSKGGKDQPPPQPVEPYGARKPLEVGGHDVSSPFSNGHIDYYKNSHGTDETLAGKPEGPKKPIKPPHPFDPYGSRKPSSAHRGLGYGAVNSGGHDILMMTFKVGDTVHTLAQYFRTTPTPTLSVNM